MQTALLLPASDLIDSVGVTGHFGCREATLIMHEGTPMATIEICDSVLSALRGRAGEKGFNNVEEYVRFVLVQLADRIRAQDASPTPTKDDEKAIQDMLRSLGYLE